MALSIFFGYPGTRADSPDFDELYKAESAGGDSAHILMARHEQRCSSTALMAITRATGEVVSCFATSGPGATIVGIASTHGLDPDGNHHGDCCKVSRAGDRHRWLQETGIWHYVTSW